MTRVPPPKVTLELLWGVVRELPLRWKVSELLNAVGFVPPTGADHQSARVAQLLAVFWRYHVAAWVAGGIRTNARIVRI
jgi:hypothetical protein